MNLSRLTFTERSVFLTLFFTVLPIIDMANGFLVVRGFISEGGIASPSQLGRFLMMACMLFLCVKHSLNIVWILLFLPFVLIEIYAAFIHQDISAFLFGLISVYKLVYAGLLAIVFSFFFRTFNDVVYIASFLKLNLLIISTTLMFSLFSGLGNSTYGHGFGTKGFFASGNGLGVYMGVMGLVLYSLRHYGLYRNIKPFHFIYIALSTAIIGSKTAFIFALLLLLVPLFLSKYRYVLLAFSGTFIVLVLPALMNLLGSVFDIVVLRYQNSESLGAFLASGRDGYVSDAFKVLAGQSYYEIRLFLGGGSVLSFQNPVSTIYYDTLESDFFDLLFMYGFYGVVFYLVSFFAISMLLIKYPLMLVAHLMLFLHSIFAGHVVFNGMSMMAFSLTFIFAKVAYVSHR